MDAIDELKTRYLEADSLKTTSGKWNLTAELISLAHTLNATVITCSWCGVKIACMEYFSRTLTEVGVCYTFNSEKVQNKKGRLRVYSAGSDCGLHLRINIQSHEYFFGEGDASGLRVGALSV